MNVQNEDDQCQEKRKPPAQAKVKPEEYSYSQTVGSIICSNLSNRSNSLIIPVLVI